MFTLKTSNLHSLEAVGRGRVSENINYLPQRFKG